MRATFAAIALSLAATGGHDAPSNSVARPAAAAAPLQFTGYVVDQAGVLTAQERQRLTQRLGEFQRTTAHQMVVVTVSGLNGEDVAHFTDRLGTRWGVGRKGINDGIVVLVAPHDRKARISVGSGLTRRLPDTVCQHIMDRVMIPAFKAGRIGHGIEQGVTAILRRFGSPATNAR